MRYAKAAPIPPAWQAPALLIFVCGFVGFAGLAQAQTEVCDGIDNNGNGLVDEGFDTDGDGVARCCFKEPFFVTTDRPTRQKLVAHHRGCASGGFTAGPAPLAEVGGASKIRVNGVADVTQNGVYDVVWTEVVGGGPFPRNVTHCNGLEWVTQQTGSWDYNYFGGADIDGNSHTDLVAWDVPTGAGVTAFGFGGSFTEVYGHYDASPAVSNWGKARVYNLQDLDGNSWPDLVLHSYATGGPSTTDLHRVLNNSGTFGPTIPMINQVPGQPQNWGDLGNINLRADYCTDWIGGPDDDADRGAVFAFFGDCAGGFTNLTQVADACPGSCPGSGVSHGSGMSQLFDWNCDDRLELLTSHVVHTGSTATVTYWEWDDVNTTFTNPVVVINNAAITAKIASPLRN